MMDHKKISIIVLLCLIILPPLVSGQFYFGKNKVQYTEFDWQIMTTEHFKVYFYPEEAEVAAVAAKLAEDAYRDLAIKFNHEVKKKVPLVIYSTPGHFVQTNIIPGLLPESVAGFTEFLKGRVVVPFHGSYYDFNHVIKHEMVHVFTLSKLDEVTARRSRVKYNYPPLWFTEGLAEFWSKDWDTEADMVVGDMVLNDRLLSITELYRVRGTFFMYKLGESICYFIDSEYGSDKLVKIFDNWHKGKTFDEVCKITLGDNLKEMSKKWEYYLKKQYYPSIDSLGFPDMESDRLTYDGYNVEFAPLRWDDGSGERDWIIYKANRFGYSGIYMKPADKRKNNIKTLVRGDKSSDFESLHLLRSGIDAHPNGRIIFSSKSKESDVLYIYDLNVNKITHRFEFGQLAAVRSPRFSNDGSKVIFSGIKKSGYTDLYLFDLVDSSYSPVTTDSYHDIDPVFSYDDQSIIFTSDRNNTGSLGYTNLFEVNLSDYKINQLTFGSYKDKSPEPTKDGIYFISDRKGIFNIYYLNHLNELTIQSDYATGAFRPRLNKASDKLFYTGYQKMGFNIFSMDIYEEPKQIEFAQAESSIKWKPKTISGEFRKTSIKYDTDYSFDIAQSSIGYDPVYGSIGGLQVAMSDVLGNHSIYFLLTNTAKAKSDLLESFNVGITYINRKHRLNWGVGGFHLFDEYFNDYDGYYFERQVGGMALFSYPISKFQRFDITNFSRYSKRENGLFSTSWEKFLTTQYFSYVYDNTLWEYTGPLEGRRYNLSMGLTVSLSDRSNWNRLYSADVRHYFRLGKFSSFANRLFAYHSSGQQPQRIYFGGSWSFRGFDRREFYVRNVLFASSEIRFPLVDQLYIGFPVGGMGFSGIRGALFFDVGSMWNEEFDQFIGSFGAGIRVALARFLVLRFDFSRVTDFNTVSSSTKVDFFFGWNF